MSAVEVAGFKVSEHTWKVKLACDTIKCDCNFWMIEGPPQAKKAGTPGPPYLVPFGKVGNQFLVGSDAMVKAIAPQLFQGPGVQAMHDRIEDELNMRSTWLMWVDDEGFGNSIVGQVRKDVCACVPVFAVNNAVKEVRTRRKDQLKEKVGCPTYPKGYDRNEVLGKVDAFVGEMSKLLAESKTGWLNNTQNVSASDIALFATLVKLIGGFPIYPELPQKIGTEAWMTIEVWYRKMQEEFPSFNPKNPALYLIGVKKGSCYPVLVQQWQEAGPMATE